MNPLQTELLARDRVASTRGLVARRHALPDPGPLPPRRGPLAMIVSAAARLGARVRVAAGALPIVRVAP